MSDAVVSQRIVVRGRVQGVGYRAWAVSKAQSLALAGWARNRVDGSVELLLSGPAAAVDAMTDACRKGPLLARVDALEAGPAPADAECPQPFERWRTV